MTLKNADMPAMPTQSNGGDMFGGLTKLETFCLHMGVAETGYAELDDIIRKGNRQKMVIAAMQGLLSNHGDDDYDDISIAKYSVGRVNALLAELERTK